MSFLFKTKTKKNNDGDTNNANDSNSQMDDSASPPVPRHFLCPISHSVMIDPVVDPEGNSYERSAIEQWLSQHLTSPVTRSTLLPTDLTVNRALKEAIQQSPFAPLPKAKNQTELKPVIVPLPEDTTSLSVDSFVSGAVGKTVEVLVSVVPPVATQSSRPSHDVCLVIDVSGSMCTNAAIKNEQGKSESHGLSLLDIVRHAAKTVVQSLTARDRVSIVKYSNTASCVFELTAMTTKGKTDAIAALDRLRTEGQTNLWDGLEVGLESLRRGREAQTDGPSRNASVLLLTDGCPNVVPPRGHLGMLRMYRDKQCGGSLPASVHTFGFGYSLNTKILHELAEEGDGGYFFIPDASFVGTCFVHAASNILSTSSTNVKLNVMPLQDATVVVNTSYPVVDTSWGPSVNLGDLKYQQSKNLVVQRTLPENYNGKIEDYLTCTLQYDYPSDTQPTPITKTIDCSVKECMNDDRNLKRRSLEKHQLRADFVKVVKEAAFAAFGGEGSQTMDEKKSSVLKLVKKMKGSFLLRQNSPDDKQKKEASALLEDAAGQVTEACSKDAYFNKWGRHYLPSLARSHLLQQCSNFKDPGLQVYGGELFQHIRDYAEKIFLKIPPPKPSAHGYSGGTVNMYQYNNRYAGCFVGNVLLANGTRKPTSELRKGDIVATLVGDKMENATATIECVVKTRIDHSFADLTNFEGGLTITQWHPIYLDGKWQFPSQTKSGVTQGTNCPYVYSILLKSFNGTDRGVAVNVSGIWAISLAHGIVNDEVASHDFFGTEKVTNCLEKLDGFENGYIELQPGPCVKDPNTGLVVNIVQRGSGSGSGMLDY